jgi:hypothetical protein
MSANSVDSLREGEYVAIRTCHGTYLSAQPKMGLEYRPAAAGWERFQLIAKGKRKWAFRTEHGQYLSAHSKDNVLFNADTPLRRETFRIEGNQLSAVALYSPFHAFYLSAQPGAGERGKVECNRARPQEWERFAIERLPK